MNLTLEQRDMDYVRAQVHIISAGVAYLHGSWFPIRHLNIARVEELRGMSRILRLQLGIAGNYVRDNPYAETSTDFDYIKRHLLTFEAAVDLEKGGAAVEGAYDALQVLQRRLQELRWPARCDCDCDCDCDCE